MFSFEHRPPLEGLSIFFFERVQLEGKEEGLSTNGEWARLEGNGEQKGPQPQISFRLYGRAKSFRTSDGEAVLEYPPGRAEGQSPETEVAADEAIEDCK